MRYVIGRLPICIQNTYNMPEGVVMGKTCDLGTWWQSSATERHWALRHIHRSIFILGTLEDKGRLPALNTCAAGGAWYSLLKLETHSRAVINLTSFWWNYVIFLTYNTTNCCFIWKSRVQRFTEKDSPGNTYSAKAVLQPKMTRNKWIAL